MPIIPFAEPVSPRYIYIDAATNKVHLMVPVVSGQEISTDNTCKARVSSREFFEGGALRELNAYKEALVFDIGLLEVGNAQRVSKEVRLAQIKNYIEAVSAMRMSFDNAMTALLRRSSNLYTIQLRPRAQDSESLVVNPVFNLNRANNNRGTPCSPLYNEMHSTFPKSMVLVIDPRSRLTTAVLNVLPIEPSFADIQQALKEQSLALFGLTIDFTQLADGTPATKEVIDTLMSFGEDATREDYINTLLGACALHVWETLLTPPFYSIPAATREPIKTERLSILTQFFLGNLNVYCKARGISGQNFGVVLDASYELSHDLVSVVSTALMCGDDVERAICNFCNVNADSFKLSRALNASDLMAIRQTFERTYRTVTATDENPYMDDFMILDKEATGERAKFVTHQGSICVNFAEIIDPTAASINPSYFESIRADFAAHSSEIPHKNDSVAGYIEMDVETFLARINDDQFERLSIASKKAVREHPSFQAHYFLHDVAKGKQDEAEALLTATSANTQNLLRTPGEFTDYSGRTFNCTAYEYAYWAKDTHMCRMLETHMDEETKIQLLARIDANEAEGLFYQQNGKKYGSAHFDLTALKTALQTYVDGYDALYIAHDWPAITAAWKLIGKAQHNVPAHVAHEYCRPDRSFDPCPSFDERTLPRVLTFYNWIFSRDDSWFSLTSSNAMWGAGGRGERLGGGWAFGGGRKLAQRDLTAITRLDEVRTADLKQSREHLNPPALSLRLRM